MSARRCGRPPKLCQACARVGGPRARAARALREHGMRTRLLAATVGIKRERPPSTNAPSPVTPPGFDR